MKLGSPCPRILQPSRELWKPVRFQTRPSGIAVRFKTQLCDAHGRVERDLQEGWNEITDWGMNALDTIRIGDLTSYLHLSSALGPGKKIGTGGQTLTLTITDASNIAVVASTNFFAAGDVGETLSITDLGGVGIEQELKITAFADATHVTCSTRGAVWLPGVTAGTGPFSTFGVHYTSGSTLATQFSKFNTYDTTDTNYFAEINDSGNSRSIFKRTFLSAVNGGAAWTINQLGWSDGNAGNNVFGKANLASADTVPTGKKYRVTLQVYLTQTPIDIASQSVNWGATIGTYDLAMRMERLAYLFRASYDHAGSFLHPVWYDPGSTRIAWWTAAFSLVATKWEGDAGYDSHPHTSPAGTSSLATVADSSYTSGTHTKTRTVTLADGYVLTNVTGIVVYVGSVGAGIDALTIKPVTGTITKPSGYWGALGFPLYWTRNFVN